MIWRKSLGICFLGFLILSAGCVPISKTTLSPGSPEDLPRCYAIFPTEPWESVHKIEATFRRGGSFSLLGVTKGEPSERRFESLLLTPEGFILFDAEFRDGEMAVRKAVAPFDSPAFAGGLMEDVSLLFLPPRVRPAGWEKKTDGMMVCNWEGPEDSDTEIKGSMESGWRILRRDKYREVIKEVLLKGPFVNGLASHVELRTSEPASYTLRMTLVQQS
ncbi:MAG TPA: hypothetical protein VMV04_13890, partial [Thermodesulfobacteriota bacterium]|nr:hypothetical protein [Thermodesulfobacteriota bacterium]